MKRKQSEIMEKEEAGTHSLKGIDHIAIALHDLEEGITYFEKVLGFTLLRRRTIKGETTGMISAEMQLNGIKFVLCQGTEKESQVSKLIEHFGSGVAHIAFSVTDVEDYSIIAKERGMEFETKLIGNAGLKQIFTKRDINTGLSFELIERHQEENFNEENIKELFSQLEKSNSY